MIAPYILMVGIGIVATCVTIVLYRAYTMNTSKPVFLGSSIAVAIATTFFYFILWLSVTLMNPKENYFAPISIALFMTGLLPALILGISGYTSNQTNEENKNE